MAFDFSVSHSCVPNLQRLKQTEVKATPWPIWGNSMVCSFTGGINQGGLQRKLSTASKNKEDLAGTEGRHPKVGVRAYAKAQS